MRLWEIFFPDVLPDVLGCPEPTVERHLLRAAQVFCQRTLAYRADLATIMTLASTPSYTIVYPTETQLVKIVGATLDSYDIPVEAADETSAQDRINGTRGDKRILLPDATTVTIMPTQAAGVALKLVAALQPAEDATGFFSNAVADRYRPAICTGALATLLNINKSEWRNATLAGEKAAQFDRMIAKARTEAWKAYGRARPRVTGMYF